jgi:phosphoglycolate phosphatase-like HAD superfamily hydrolase
MTHCFFIALFCPHESSRLPLVSEPISGRLIDCVRGDGCPFTIVKRGLSYAHVMVISMLASLLAEGKYRFLRNNHKDTYSISLNFPTSFPFGMSLQPNVRFLELAVFRFEDVCVRVQDGMDGYLRTAALEKVPGIEATFRWLRRRKVKIALLTDYNREEVTVLLDRLGWLVGEENLIQLIVLEQAEQDNPIRQVLDYARINSPLQAIVVADTPRLLRCATGAGSQLVFGVTNGRSSYHELVAAPYGALLDSSIQLPDYLLRTMPENEYPPLDRGSNNQEPPRLWLSGWAL